MLKRSDAFQYRSHSYAHAIASKNKYLLNAHGDTLRSTFRVPRHMTIIFMTYPGAVSYESVIQTTLGNDANARKVMLRQHPGVLHSAMYMPGDQVHDMGLQFFGPGSSPFGVFKIGSPHSQSLVRVPRFTTKLSRMVNKLQGYGTEQDPIVVFVSSCRSCGEKTFQSCAGMNRLACAKQNPHKISIPKHVRTAKNADSTARLHSWGVFARSHGIPTRYF